MLPLELTESWTDIQLVIPAECNSIAIQPIDPQYAINTVNVCVVCTNYTYSLTWLFRDLFAMREMAKPNENLFFIISRLPFPLCHWHCPCVSVCSWKSWLFADARKVEKETKKQTVKDKQEIKTDKNMHPIACSRIVRFITHLRSCSMFVCDFL